MGEIRNKRVLVTGGAGFIGSHLTRRLVQEGADVAVLVKYNSIIDNIRIADLWDTVKIFEADIRNTDSLTQLKDFRPEIVYHLAAYNHVGDSFLHVNEAMDVNSRGTANLVNSIGDFEKLIYISTSEVYGGQKKVPFVETMTPNPISPYSVGKYSGELYCNMLMTEMKRPVVVLRPFNAFGPYQSSRAVIAEIILKCLRNEPVMATEGKQTREFNFVSNLVDGFILAAKKDGAVGHVINLGGAEEISIRDVISMIHEKCDSGSELHFGKLDTRPTEIWRMYAENSKARDILGWHPEIKFANGLEKAIEWYKLFNQEFVQVEGMAHRLAKAS